MPILLIKFLLLMPDEGVVGSELQSSLLKARLSGDGSRRPFRRHWYKRRFHRASACEGASFDDVARLTGNVEDYEKPMWVVRMMELLC